MKLFELVYGFESRGMNTCVKAHNDIYVLNAWDEQRDYDIRFRILEQDSDGIKFSTIEVID